MASLTLAELAARPIWAAWKPETRDGRVTKVAYDPMSGRRAASDDAATWATRSQAEFWAIKERAGGVGIMLCTVGDVCLAGAVLGACRNKDTGDIAPWAQEIIDRFGTYTEVLPSGTGVKLLFTIAAADMAAVETLFDNKWGRAFKNGGGDHPAGDRGLSREEIFHRHRRGDQRNGRFAGGRRCRSQLADPRSRSEIRRPERESTWQGRKPIGDSHSRRNNAQTRGRFQ
jgi:hypothetical protein